MRRLIAVAELRLREAASARLAALAPLAFLAGLAAAAWVPGSSDAARASSADLVILSAALGTALLVVVVLGASSFAEDVRTGRALTLLATPVSRLEVVLGGIAGHAVFGFLLALALAGGGLLGLEAGGLGTRARDGVRPAVAAEVAGRGPDGFAVLSESSPSVGVRFRVPPGLAPGEPIRFRLAPRGRVETRLDQDGTLAAAVHRPGESPRSWATVAYKAGVAFDVDAPAGDLRGGESAELTLVRRSGGWSLRFGDGSVEVAGPRRLFTGEVLLAIAAAAPLLLAAAAGGAAASARLGAATAIALAAFVVLVGSGRDVIEDAAAYVVARAEAQAAEAAEHDGHGHDHEGHEHEVRVTAVQTALARSTLAAFRVVPDLSRSWRVDDVAAGRAARASDFGPAAARAILPCAGAALLAWVLLRRRELVPS